MPDLGPQDPNLPPGAPDPVDAAVGPGDETCPECGAQMQQGQCPVCGYAHQTPVPATTVAPPSPSALTGVKLGEVVRHIATQGLATTNPDELETLGKAANQWAQALKIAHPPPSTVDATQQARIEADAVLKQEQMAQQAADAEATRMHEAAQAEQGHQHTIEQTLTQAAVTPPAVTGGGGGG